MQRNRDRHMLQICFIFYHSVRYKRCEGRSGDGQHQSSFWFIDPSNANSRQEIKHLDCRVVLLYVDVNAAPRELRPAPLRVYKVVENGVVEVEVWHYTQDETRWVYFRLREAWVK